MTARRSTRRRRKELEAEGALRLKRRARRMAATRLNPYLGFLLFVGIGLGTWRLETGLRLTGLWVALLVLTLIHADERPLEVNYSLRNLGRGALVGFLVSLPFVVLGRNFLFASAARLFAADSALILFQRLVLIMAPVEEGYFRGVLQRDRGLAMATLSYIVAAAVYFVPVSVEFPAVLAALIVGTGILGFVYGYVYQRYGLAASVACHGVANCVILVLPVVVMELGELLAVS